MTTNKFENYAIGKTESAIDAFIVTPHDTVDFAEQARALYVGVSGDIVLITPKNTSVPLVNVVAGSILPISFIRINATGTEATNLVGLV